MNECIGRSKVVVSQNWSSKSKRLRGWKKWWTLTVNELVKISQKSGSWSVSLLSLSMHLRERESVLTLFWPLSSSPPLFRHFRSNRHTSKSAISIRNSNQMVKNWLRINSFRMWVNPVFLARSSSNEFDIVLTFRSFVLSSTSMRMMMRSLLM